MRTRRPTSTVRHDGDSTDADMVTGFCVADCQRSKNSSAGFPSEMIAVGVGWKSKIQDVRCAAV